MSKVFRIKPLDWTVTDVRRGYYEARVPMGMYSIHKKFSENKWELTVLFEEHHDEHCYTFNHASDAMIAADADWKERLAPALEEA